MGLFGSKRKTYVSSVAYNLAGEEDDQIDFLKYTVLQSVMQRRNISETITHGYLTGQGISLRSAHSYARKDYFEGLPQSEAVYFGDIDPSAMVAVLEKKHPSTGIVLLTTYVGTADFTWWVEEHLAKEYGYDRTVERFLRPPKGVEADALVAYDIEHSGLVNIILTNQNGNTRVLTFRPKGIQQNGAYIHSAYRHQRDYFSADEVTTRPTESGDTAGSSTSETTEDRGGSSRVIYTTTKIEIEDGTTTITKSVRTRVRSEVQYFFYRLGSGKHLELDALLSTQTDASPYYPSIPLRVDNEDYTDEKHQRTQLYKTGEKFLNKLGIDMAQVSEQVNDNDQVDEIDYAFIVFGVDIRTEHWATKEYLYRFFQYLDSLSAYVEQDFIDWENQGGVNRGSPKTNTLKIRNSRHEKDRYNIELQWQYITTEVKTGSIGDVGHIDITSGGGRTFNFKGSDLILDASSLYVRKQITENAYEEMRIVGLTHENHIYNGHSVILTTQDAFTEEDESGFILPLNRAILQQMSLKVVTQLAYNCTHIVFNSYKVVKKRWYQRGWFKVVLVVAAIVITVLTMGADGGSTLAWSWSVSAAQAITGLAITTSILVSYLAATIYVLGAMVLSSILIDGATSLFGQELGQVIGAIATMVAMNWGNWQNTFTNMSKQNLTASTVIKATSAVGKIHNAYIQGQMMGIAEDMQREQEEYESEYDRIQALYKEFFNPNAGLLDIQGYIDAGQSFMYESPGTFFSRTLLTGSDVARITNNMIEHFADLGLELPSAG